jgi:ribonuclease BN (tRNA processing enzyme)
MLSIIAVAASLAIASLHNPAPSDSTTIVLLGTGMPRPDPTASGPATAIVYGSRVFLFDVGAGTERQLSAAHLPIDGPTALFITHLHSDHTLGLADLILTSWVMGRARPFRVVGPSGTRAMVNHLMAAWREDITIRTNGMQRGNKGGDRVVVQEISKTVVYDSAGVRITAVPVAHGDWKHAYGFRIDTPDRSIVISGDTRPTAALVAAARNADVLIHEVYPESRLAPEPRPGGEKWPAYMRAFHTSDVEVGKLANAAGVHLVILQHVVSRNGATDDDLIAGVRQGGFAGRVVVGKDLDRY